MNKSIAIAGAGIGGLCCAYALAKKGFEVSIYEQSARLSEVGAGLQLSPNAMHVLAALGLSNAVEAKGFRPNAAVMRHYQNGDTYFTLPLGNQTVHKYGAQYIHIHRADLHNILFENCLKAGVSVHLSKSVQSFSQQGEDVELHFTDNKSVHASVLVGADGIKSKVQSCMLGQSPAQFTGQVAWRGVVDAAKLPVSLIKHNANLWVGPGKHFVSYYLRGGSLINFVAVQERKDWQDESWTQTGNVQELRSVFSGWHNEVTQLLDEVSECFLWALFNRAPLAKWSHKNVTLLGDACHPTLPFLAQGAAMAIEDSYTLAHYLSTTTSSIEALQKYEEQRQPRTRSVVNSATKNAALYHMSTPLQRAKLSVLSGLSTLGLSDGLAAKKLDAVYGYNVVERLGK